MKVAFSIIFKVISIIAILFFLILIFRLVSTSIYGGLLRGLLTWKPLMFLAAMAVSFAVSIKLLIVSWHNDPFLKSQKKSDSILDDFDNVLEAEPMVRRPGLTAFAILVGAGWIIFWFYLFFEGEFNFSRIDLIGGLLGSLVLLYGLVTFLKGIFLLRNTGN